MLSRKVGSVSRKSTLKNLVVKICNEDQRAANNDKILIEQVWLHEGWSYARSLHDNLARVSMPESITRRRREAHLEGLINYSEESDAMRYAAFKNERDGGDY